MGLGDTLAVKTRVIRQSVCTTGAVGGDITIAVASESHRALYYQCC